MSETFSDNPEALRARVHQEQNAIEEKLREEFLPSRFFQDHVVWPTSPEEDDLTIHELMDLRKDFLEKRRDMNMGQRLDLALKPPFFGRLQVVELGLTEKPGLQGEIDGLKHEYNDLLSWMTAEGLVQGEIQRNDSQRTIELRQSHADPSRMVAIRNRPLVDAELPQPHTHIGIAKRMVFSMPKELLYRLDATVKRMTLEEPKYRSMLLSFVEREVDDRNPQIDAIRTAYYLAMHKL